MFGCSIISLASLDVPLSFKYSVNGAIFGNRIFYIKHVFLIFNTDCFYSYVTNKQTNKRTLIKCPLPYTDIHLHVSIGFATIITVLHKNTDEIEELSKLLK